MLLAKCLGAICGCLLAVLVIATPTFFLFRQSCFICKYLLDCYQFVNDEIRNDPATSIKNIPQE